MIHFSANLGFLWAELPLPEAIRAAGRAGFSAVECHWPYAVSAQSVKAALDETGLRMLGINTQRGDVEKGENGLAAIVGREDEARTYIDEAIDYAAQIGCPNVHVMAGFTDQGDASEKTFQQNLTYACNQASKAGITILIEPLNHYDAPGYHLGTADAASDTIKAVGFDNLKLMFDCYHLQIMQGDLTRRLNQHKHIIGHIQIAAVPQRNEPDQGEVNYPNLLQAIADSGWDTPIGAEYKPSGSTDAGLGWMAAYQSE